MNIFFDHDIFTKKYGGAPKCMVKILENLPSDIWETSTLLSCCEYVKGLDRFRYIPEYFSWQIKAQNLVNKYYTHYRLGRNDFDVYHQTNYRDTIYNIIKKPMVTTFHDANQAPGMYYEHAATWEKQKKACFRADHIVVVSENTKKDLINFTGIDEKKISVIYHGVDIPDLNKLPKDRFVKEPYILFVGSRVRYKNFHLFAKAFSVIHQSYPELKAVFTRGEFSQEEKSFLNELNILQNCEAFPADELLMQRLYRDALFFVFPSEYEGFGMPILEAWVCNCPVILSRASCFPEIAGDSALYFEKNNLDDLISKMQEMIDSESLRELYTKLGQERVKMFSWKHSADMHLNVYKGLI